MRRISLENVQPGMVLGKQILGGSGQVLLNAGVEIKPQYLIYLQNMGINAIYIEDKRIEGLEINDVISEETRRDTRSLVKEIMGDIQNQGVQSKSLAVRDKRIVQTVSKIVEELLNNKNMLVNLMDIRAKGDYLYAHSVNCCVLATLTAIEMKMDMDNLKCLATGAMLHDLGMATVPENILEKPGALTHDEYETVKNHTVFGYELFKKSTFYTARAGSILLQHHERYNGQGYPHEKEGGETNILAQIVAVADVYDALTSERPYRKAYPPHQAVEMLQGWGNVYFDLEILRSFLYNIAPYPLGTHVFLSNGESGLVIDCKAGYALRPKIRVLYTGEDLAPHHEPYDLDLSQVLDIVVVKVLE